MCITFPFFFIRKVSILILTEFLKSSNNAVAQKFTSQISIQLRDYRVSQDSQGTFHSHFKYQSDITILSVLENLQGRIINV